MNSAVLLIMFALLGLMMFFQIRTQKKRFNQQQQMRANLAPGNRVMTTGGLFGTVVDIDREEGTIDLEVSEGVVVTYHLSAISTIAGSEQAAAETEETEQVSEDSDQQVEAAESSATEPKQN